MEICELISKDIAKLRYKLIGNLHAFKVSFLSPLCSVLESNEII